MKIKYALTAKKSDVNFRLISFLWINEEELVLIVVLDQDISISTLFPSVSYMMKNSVQHVQVANTVTKLECVINPPPTSL